MDSLGGGDDFWPPQVARGGGAKGVPGRSRQRLTLRKGEAPSCGPRFCSAQEGPLPKEACQGEGPRGSASPARCPVQVPWASAFQSNGSSPSPSCMALPARAAFQASRPRSSALVPCDPLRRPDPFCRPCQPHWSPQPKLLVAFLPTDCWAGGLASPLLPAPPPSVSGTCFRISRSWAGSASEPPPCSLPVSPGLPLSASEKLFRFQEVHLLVDLLGKLVLGGLLAFGLGFSEFLLVSRTSSLTFSISGIFKVFEGGASLAYPLLSASLGLFLLPTQQSKCAYVTTPGPSEGLPYSRNCIEYRNPVGPSRLPLPVNGDCLWL